MSNLEGEVISEGEDKIRRVLRVDDFNCSIKELKEKEKSPEVQEHHENNIVHRWCRKVDELMKREYSKSDAYKIASQEFGYKGILAR